MKTNRKVLSMLVMCICMIFGIGASAQASGIEDNESSSRKLGSIIIDYTHNDSPLDDVDFKLYQIATEVDAGYEVLSQFSNFEIDFTKLSRESEWISLRNNLQNYIAYKMLLPDKEFITDDFGSYKIEDLEPGLYYIDAENVVKGNKEFFSEPILIMVGYYSEEEGIFLYHFRVEPKIEMIDFTDVRDITVKKIWKDVPRERLIPEYIEAELYCNGELYDSVKLNDSNHWTHTWYDIDETAEWAIIERTVLKDFVVEYDKIYDDFEIINTYIGEDPGEDPEDELPQTGTSANRIPIFAGIGLLLIMAGMCLEVKGKKDEE